MLIERKAMTAMHRPPFIDIEGCPNFRDVGGYPTKPGFCVRRRLIYRSGALTGLTQDGFVEFQHLGLKGIYDLRSRSEVDAESADGNNLVQTLQHSSEFPKIVFTPVFGDKDYSPEALAQRFKDYASKGTEVRQLLACQLKNERH